MSDANLPPVVVGLSNPPPSPPVTPVPALPDPVFAPTNGKIKPAHIDGSIVVLMGGLTALMGIMDGDQAKAILHPICLFWVQTICLTINGGLVALNGFRSLVFSKTKQ